MKSSHGFMLLEVMLSMSIMMCMVVLIGPLLLQMHTVRVQIFHRCEQIMRDHLLVAVMAQDVRQGPAQEERWHCSAGLLAWDSETPHAWKLKHGRLWFYEGGFSTPAGDGIVVCTSSLVVKNGMVRGVWIEMGGGGRTVKWYTTVYEGLE